MWVVPMKDLPNLLCQYQTSFLFFLLLHLTLVLRFCYTPGADNQVILNMWKNVMFSAMCEVWRRRGGRFADCCTGRVTSFGGGSVMVWGSISLTGKITGNLNAVRN